MTEDQKTEAVKNCKTFAELETVIKENAPFISNSRDTPVEWSSEAILLRMYMVVNGEHISNVTRANGLREKVSELLLK